MIIENIETKSFTIKIYNHSSQKYVIHFVSYISKDFHAAMSNFDWFDWFDTLYDLDGYPSYYTNNLTLDEMNRIKSGLLKIDKLMAFK